MKQFDPFAEVLRESLADAAAPRDPDYLEDVLRRTSRSRQRPAWSFAQSWVPALPGASPLASPMLRLALLVLLLVAMLGAAAIIGQQLLERRLPPPSGPARNGLLAFEAGQRIYLADPDGKNVRQLEAGLALSRQPTWSPDGRLLAFFTAPDQWTDWSLWVGDAEGNGEIIAEEVASAQVRLDTVPERIAWAPDSRALAFRGPGQQLVVVDGDGSNYRVLGDHFGVWRSHPAWSPDGTWIAFKGRPITDEAIEAFGPGAGLFIIRPDGTGERRLPTSSGRNLAFEWSQWSPDGALIAYHFGRAIEGSGELTDTGYGVATIDIATGRETVLRDDVGHEYFPVYLPSGEAVVFLERAYPPLQESAVWVVGRDGTEVVRLRIDAGESPQLCVSPDERYVLVEVTVGQQQWELQVVPLDDGATLGHATRMTLAGVSSSACWQRLPL